MTSETISLAQALIQKQSVSPEDGGCQALMADYLSELGFRIEHMPFVDVSNLWAVHSSKPGPTVCLAGHTDVVPTGPLDQWQHEPFSGVVVDDVLHGRGAADMKGSLAAMLTATRAFLTEHPEYAGSIAYLITSDEEDVAINGTVKVVQALKSRDELPAYCVIGEPSSSNQVGDVVRVGRRGSLNGRLTLRGIQGHVAYPQDADNPIHRSAPIISALTQEVWDDGNEFFPATSFQISNIHGGTGANNVIPGELVVDFNFRYSTESTDKTLIARTEALIADHASDFEVEWRKSGDPFLTTGGDLIPAVQRCIQSVCGIETELSTSGGTSDGRFIAPEGVEVVELGPTNATIHKINEKIATSELEQLSKVYLAILKDLLVQ